jgi:hypothetical protein
VCALDNFQWRGELCFAGAAISVDGCLPQNPKGGKHNVVCNGRWSSLYNIGTDRTESITLNSYTIVAGYTAAT